MKRNRKKPTLIKNIASVASSFTTVQGGALPQCVNGMSYPPNGSRFVSANAATIKMKNARNSGNTFHVNSDCDCFAITSVSVTFPTSNSTATVLMPRAISYEII